MRCTRTTRDHPRGCGAHASRGWSTASRQGSSPRVRGSPKKLSPNTFNAGIIPAGAGLTTRQAPRRKRARDHPRGCGAHRKLRGRFCSWMGSSPRVRGSRPCREKGHSRDGIIPAGAGLTPTSQRRKTDSWDHPRGCGAHNQLFFSFYGFRGSSPRVRAHFLKKE